MFVFVDIALLLALWAAIRTGWRRGFASMVLDLVGFVGAVLVTLSITRYTSEAWRWAGVQGAWAVWAGALTCFVPIIVVTAIVGARVRRVAAQPGLRMTDRVLGVAAGLSWVAIAITVFLAAAGAIGVPSWLTGAVRRSPTSQTLLTTAAPLMRGLERIADRDGDHIVGSIRRSVDTFRDTVTQHDADTRSPSGDA